MLSNSTSNLHIRQRQRQHRRQNSTPSAFEPVKTSSLPSIQKNHGHRRGMSLDQRRRRTSPHDRTVSNVNLGYLSAPQHILREAQQQGLVSPGQKYTQFNHHDSYLSSPVVTPHRLSLDVNYTNNHGGSIHRSSRPFSYLGPLNWTMGVDQTNLQENNDLNLLPDQVLPPSTYMDFNFNLGDHIENSGQVDFDRRSIGRKISDGIVDRVSQFENLALQSPHRPFTPSSHNVACCFPPTPIDTPHINFNKQEMINSRFMDGYDTSLEETIKPSIKQRACGIFNDMRKEIEVNSHLSLSNPGTVLEQISFDSSSLPMDSFMNLSNLSVELPDGENQFTCDQLFSPDSTDISSVLSGYQSCPEDSQYHIVPNSLISSTNPETTSLQYPEPVNQTLTNSLSPRPRSTHRRFDSTSTINLEESITETGITTEEIASYISGPDPGDGGKWLCMFPNCRKRFGRKENIKSHVQTHLGDRQFQCPFCKKCFVRQHDLKRHAKIHSGIKPYPCQCGNSFARHDALTRHRQRGMCIGAFEGIVKKAAKRGRPRKNRPNDKERLKKSSRTQRKNNEISISSSSISGCSDSCGASPCSDSRDSIEKISSVEPNYHQSPFSMSNTSYPLMHTQLSATNQLFSSDIDIPCSIDQKSSQVSNSCSVSEITPVPEARQHSEEADNTKSYNSPSQNYKPISSPETLSKYFDPEKPQSSSEMQMITSNVPDVSSVCTQEDDLLIDLFPETNNYTDMGNSRCDHELLDKIISSFDQGASEDELFSNSQGVFFGTP